MKHPLRILSLLVIVLVLVRGAEYVLEQALDQQLPPLLTEELGIPVRIAPLRADIFSLTAKTPRLEMGEPDNLSIDAYDVWVSLDWTDLLSGEIRLVTGAGREVMVDISAWPKDDGPYADDYANLEQWLPSMLDADLVRYRQEDGTELSFYQARWRRAGKDIDNASLAWQNRFPTGTLDVDIDLVSLDDFLWLREFDAAITLASDREGISMSELGLAVRPGADTAYEMELDGKLEGSELTLRASGSEIWTLPDRSHTRAEELYMKDLREFLELFFADGEEDAYEQEMAGQVWNINLPRHDGRLEIGELRAGKEMLHDVAFNLNSNGNYLAITEITASGAYGDLLGSAAIASVDGGWDTALAADMTARTTDNGLLSRYVEAHWFARQGRIRLKSQGETWADLLDELTGSLRITGDHRGKEETPVTLRAMLDGSPDRFALEEVELQLGNSSVTGKLDVSSRGEKFANITARGDAVDLRFLLEEEEDIGEPGVALPTFLTWLPNYRVTADLDFEALLLEDIQLDKVTVAMDRGLGEGSFNLVMLGDDGGSLGIELDYKEVGPDAVDTNIGFKLDRVQLSEIFDVRFGSNEFDSRTSGTIDLVAQGRDVKDIFSNSRGLAKLQVEVRRDGDWSRPSTTSEIVAFNGQTSLVIEGNSIVGITVEDLDIDTIEQDVTGTVSLIVTRDPVAVADLRSERLNIDSIVSWLPENPDAEAGREGMDFLLDTPPGQFKLRVGTLTWQDRNFDNVDVEIASRPGAFNIEKLSIGHKGAQLDGSMTLVGKGTTGAVFGAKASIKDLRILKVTDVEEQRLREHLAAPLEGSLELESDGETFEQLLMGLNGQMSLDTTDPSDPDPDSLDITFERLPEGGLINVRSLKLAGSQLQGSLRTTDGTPVRYDVDITGGALDLRPWGLTRKPDEDPKPSESSGGAVEQTAETARYLVGFAGRLLGGAGDTEEGERVFSSEPSDLTVLYENDVHVTAKLDKLYSRVVFAENLNVEGHLGQGRIDFIGKAAKANGGPVQVDVQFDGNASPHTMALNVLGEGVHQQPEQDNYPTSLHGIATTSGNSEAELAANMNGQVYFELGRGPIDYRGLAFLTADAASSMFRALIPGAKDRVPEMRCGVAFMQVKDGMGVTPYGYAAQTRSANLLGGIELDLVKEKVRIRFRSRSREGAGLSIGNAFSSTVELAGPLGNPQIVPNTPGLLFRGWAAFMTAGLSVLGESVFNRVLASENPCTPVQEEIRKDLCTTDQVLAGSPLACPTIAVASADNDD